MRKEIFLILSGGKPLETVNIYLGPTEVAANSFCTKLGSVRY